MVQPKKKKSPWGVCLFSCLVVYRGEHKAIEGTQVPPGCQLSPSSVECLWKSQVPFKMFTDLGFRFWGSPLSLGSCVCMCTPCSAVDLSLNMNSFSHSAEITPHQAFGRVAASGFLQCPHLRHLVSALLLLLPSLLLICLLQTALISKSFSARILSPPELPNRRSPNHPGAQ